MAVLKGAVVAILITWLAWHFLVIFAWEAAKRWWFGPGLRRRGKSTERSCGNG